MTGRPLLEWSDGAAGPLLAAGAAGRPAWQDRALCSQADPEAWFPKKGVSPAAARRVCMACAVRADCLGYAIENNERFGIWGGFTWQERRRVRQERQAAA